MRITPDYARQFELWGKLMAEALSKDTSALVTLRDSLPHQNLTNEQQKTILKRINHCLSRRKS